uniref:Sulfatase-modifying factor enzyme-like domain-containing protein n=1 Tax=Papio anubis TaxID=9555 RepID=A0A8I5NQF9_PAPAN
MCVELDRCSEGGRMRSGAVRVRGAAQRTSPDSGMGWLVPLLSLLLLLVGAWLKLGNGQATSMVQLPGGRFLMGTNSPDSRDGEGPVREATVKPFAIDIFPVTNKDFRDFVREKKYRTEAEMFGWSFVFEDFVSDELRNKATQPMKDGQHSRFSLRQPRFPLCCRRRPAARGAVSSRVVTRRKALQGHCHSLAMLQTAQFQARELQPQERTSPSLSPIPLWQAPLTRAGS